MMSYKPGLPLLCLVANLPEPEVEYRFDATRHYRFDYAWPVQRVAVEVDGGQWLPFGGRHARDSDREKHNRATASGWRVLHFSPQQLRDDPWHCMELLRQALQASGAER